MTSLSLQYGRFHYSPFANIQLPTTSNFSTDLDETGIKMHVLKRSFIYIGGIFHQGTFYKQTVEILIRRRVLRRLIWV